MDMDLLSMCKQHGIARSDEAMQVVSRQQDSRNVEGQRRGVPGFPSDESISVLEHPDYFSPSPHHLQMRTGMLVCVTTLCVSLPITRAEIPRRPCEAMTIRSQPFSLAVRMIPL
jgi:hypothetical protein